MMMMFKSIQEQGQRDRTTGWTETGSGLIPGALDGH